MALETQELASFAVLAEQLHFGRAAARLHISQPALSKRMRSLEEKIGGPLLARCCQRRSAVVRDTHLVGTRSQQDREQARGIDIVLHHEDTQRSRPGGQGGVATDRAGRREHRQRSLCGNWRGSVAAAQWRCCRRVTAMAVGGG